MTRIVVLGGGPAGYVAACAPRSSAPSVTLVESREIGGTCLNRGCIPTKAMVAAAERLRAARDAAEFGIVLGDAARRLGGADRSARKAAVTSSCAAAWSICSRRARSRSWPAAGALRRRPHGARPARRAGRRGRRRERERRRRHPGDRLRAGACCPCSTSTTRGS